MPVWLFLIALALAPEGWPFLLKGIDSWGQAPHLHIGKILNKSQRLEGQRLSVLLSLKTNLEQTHLEFPGHEQRYSLLP